MNEQKTEAPVLISADGARGAKTSEDGATGKALLPMLITLIVFAVIGFSIGVNFGDFD